MIKYIVITKTNKKHPSLNIIMVSYFFQNNEWYIHDIIKGLFMI